MLYCCTMFKLGYLLLRRDLCSHDIVHAGESMRFEVFKKQLERNKIKDIEVRQLPPLDPKKLCRRSTKTLRRELDKTALERTERLLAKPASGPVGRVTADSVRV